MISESQNIEFKESWRDEYLKWICGFANAQGGKLYIGRHDNGDVCGVLPENWSIEMLLSKHGSRPYNPDIANVFFRAGEIEAWGRGIERMISVCSAIGCKKPEFRYDGAGLWTIFEFKGTTQETTQETTRETTQEKFQKRTALQEEIIRYLKIHPYATRKELTDSIANATENGIKYNLSRLQEIGILKRIGSTRYGYWKIEVYEE